MNNSLRSRLLYRLLPFAGVLLPGVLPGIAAPAPGGPTTKVDFAREVQPILKAHCYQCHGGDQKAGGLRLDTRVSGLQGGVSGPAIVPGKSEKSLLLQRILVLHDVQVLVQIEPLRDEPGMSARHWPRPIATATRKDSWLRKQNCRL